MAEVHIHSLLSHDSAVEVSVGDGTVTRSELFPGPGGRLPRPTGSGAAVWALR